MRTGHKQAKKIFDASTNLQGRSRQEADRLVAHKQEDSP